MKLRSKDSVRKSAALQKSRARFLVEHNLLPKEKDWFGCERKVSTSSKYILRKKSDNEQNK